MTDALDDGDADAVALADAAADLALATAPFRAFFTVDAAVLAVDE